MPALTRRTFALGAAALGAAACGPRMNTAPATIVVDRPSALIDEPVRIELRSFAPRRPVRLTATITYQHGARWQSGATFVADEHGHVDVTREAPTAGTYDGVSPMGFLWSAERVSGPTEALPADYAMQPSFVDLVAEAADGARAEARLERHLVGPGVTRQPIRTAGIVGTLFLPPGDGLHPAVIVLNGGVGGLNEPWAAILASRGYAALALGYFGVEGLPHGLVNIPLEYFETAILWMRAQPWLKDGFLGVWGPSRGGELALLLGATFPDINAVVAWVPSGVVFWALGLAEPGDTRPRAAWTYRGKALPTLQENNTTAIPSPAIEPGGPPVAYTPLYRSHLRDARAVERATIPVEKTRGPILLVSATDDQAWPSSEMADIAMRRLEAHRHPHPFRHLKYEGAGHLIPVPYYPTTIRAVAYPVQGFEGYSFSQGGSPKVDADACVDAWRQTLQFLADARLSAARRAASP